MEIYVAGAGAGKTSNMAQKIYELHCKVDKHKIIFCITFTNNAAECIKNKLMNYYSEIPSNIKISTIHSFLYSEIIKPYYFILYQKQFSEISISELPTNSKYKASKIKELETKGILHQTSIPEKAKWVIYKKSSDKKEIKEKRKTIINLIAEYFGAVCIDEAQDMDAQMKIIFDCLDESGIPLLLMGDPKQDLKGIRCFSEIIKERVENVKYLEQCYRCPQSHINISNQLISLEERQKSTKTDGVINVFFESEINIHELIQSNQYDLKYISKKQGYFDTHEDKESSESHTLIEEIRLFLTNEFPLKPNILILKVSHYYANEIIKRYNQTNDKKSAMKVLCKTFDLSKQYYAAIINAIPNIEKITESGTVYVNSIDIVKGQEGNRCLFILTSDLASYLFEKKNCNNKMKNKLYVALTRSLNILDIFITLDVEEKYNKEKLITVLLSDTI